MYHRFVIVCFSNNFGIRWCSLSLKNVSDISVCVILLFQNQSKNLVLERKIYVPSHRWLGGTLSPEDKYCPLRQGNLFPRIVAAMEKQFTNLRCKYYSADAIGL